MLILILLMLLSGVVLLVAEVMIIPGIGLAGIGGMALAGGGLWMTGSIYGSTTMGVALSICIVLFALLCLLVSKSGLVDKMKLKAEIESKAVPDTKLEVGMQGVTVTRLNLYGKVKFDREMCEVKALHYVDEGVAVKVVEVSENQILVEKV